jgi:hypothetical protein
VGEVHGSLLARGSHVELGADFFEEGWERACVIARGQNSSNKG